MHYNESVKNPPLRTPVEINLWQFNDIPVARDQWLDRSRVKKTGSRISTITMLSGDSYSGKIFMDATYEGDLLAAAGVDYHEASYERRREILKEHRNYQQGWLYFVANDPRVPKSVRDEMNRWGLLKDEFLDNGHWPHQIYVREARRMIGHFIMPENELMTRRATPDSVGMGSYTIDSHNVQRYVTPEGYVQNEGDIGVPIRPYPIAYGSLVPKKGQADNLYSTMAFTLLAMSNLPLLSFPIRKRMDMSSSTQSNGYRNKRVTIVYQRRNRNCL